jgi:hypothetical protein
MAPLHTAFLRLTGPAPVGGSRTARTAVRAIQVALGAG